MYTFLVNKTRMLEQFQVTVREYACSYGKVPIIPTFYITREKQPDPQAACINITTISDIEIWDTYIKNIFLNAIVQNSHTAPSALFQCCYMDPYLNPYFARIDH